MTQTYDQMMPKMQNGNCFMSIFDYAGTNLYNSPAHVNDTENPKFMAPLVPEEAQPSSTASTTAAAPVSGPSAT